MRIFQNVRYSSSIYEANKVSCILSCDITREGERGANLNQKGRMDKNALLVEADQ